MKNDLKNEKPFWGRKKQNELWIRSSWGKWINSGDSCEIPKIFKSLNFYIKIELLVLLGNWVFLPETLHTPVNLLSFSLKRTCLGDKKMIETFFFLAPHPCHFLFVRRKLWRTRVVRLSLGSHSSSITTVQIYYC